VRISVPISSTPTADQMWSTPLADVFDIRANFAGSYPDANSVASCIMNPSEADAYQIQCGSGYIGSVTINTSGAAMFNTGKLPFVRGSAQSTPGNNGGSVSVPTKTTNADLLILLVTQGNSVACLSASSISGGRTWTQLTGGSISANSGLHEFIYTKMASNEPATYTYTATGGGPGLIMLDVANAASVTTPDALQSNVGYYNTVTIPATSGLSTS